MTELLTSDLQLMQSVEDKESTCLGFTTNVTTRCSLGATIAMSCLLVAFHRDHNCVWLQPSGQPAERGIIRSWLLLMSQNLCDRALSIVFQPNCLLWFSCHLNFDFKMQDCRTPCCFEMSLNLNPNWLPKNQRKSKMLNKFHFTTLHYSKLERQFKAGHTKPW